MASINPDDDVFGIIAPPSTPERLAIRPVLARNDSGMAIDDHEHDAAAVNETTAAAAADESDHEVAVTQEVARVGPPQVVTIADTNFYVFVGPFRARFTFDINDMRRESSLFRNAPRVTGFELRREDPAAFQIIHNWFSGHVGDPPITREARDLFMRASYIAKELQLRECESQLLVIVHKAAITLAEILMRQVHTGFHYTQDQIAELVEREMRGYMIRSPNVGGVDDGDDSDIEEDFGSDDEEAAGVAGAELEELN